MEQKLILLILFFFSIFKSGHSVGNLFSLYSTFDEKSFTIVFESFRSYPTRLILYQNETTPRYEMAPNYFDCSLVIGKRRHCSFFIKVSPVEDCTFGLDSLHYPFVTNLKYSKKSRTSGGDIVITGNYLRSRGGPNYVITTFDYFTNFVVKVPPGSGYFEIAFDEMGDNFYPFSYESPKISSTVLDSLKGILTINGDNFFTDKSLVEVYFDGIMQPNFNISVNHTQIKVNNVKRSDPGPMSVSIKVNEISTVKNISHCFSALIISISSVSNYSDDPSQNGGKNLPVNVNFGGCNSINPNGVSLTFNTPTLSSGSFINGFVTLIGTNFGKNDESFVQLYGNGINDNIKIVQLNVSYDEKSLTFKLPLLRCKTFNINFTRSNMTSNTISISASSLLINVTNRPTVSNGTLNIELYYMDCPISSSSEQSITVGSSSSIQCSIPSLQSSNSSFYVTKCSTPYGTGINNKFIFNLNSETLSDEYSYAPPNIESQSVNHPNYQGVQL
ncbi:hypothetical protein ACTFIY_010484 [Dictyostelium cf. discoideum]